MIKEKHILRVPEPDDIPRFLEIAMRMFASSGLENQMDMNSPVPLDQREKIRSIAFAAVDELKMENENEQEIV